MSERRLFSLFLNILQNDHTLFSGGLIPDHIYKIIFPFIQHDELILAKDLGNERLAIYLWLGRLRTYFLDDAIITFEKSVPSRIGKQTTFPDPDIIRVPP